MDFLIALGKIILGLIVAGAVLMLVLGLGSLILTKLKGNKT